MELCLGTSVWLQENREREKISANALARTSPKLQTWLNRPETHKPNDFTVMPLNHLILCSSLSDFRCSFSASKAQKLLGKLMYLGKMCNWFVQSLYSRGGRFEGSEKTKSISVIFANSRGHFEQLCSRNHSSIFWILRLRTFFKRRSKNALLANFDPFRVLQSSPLTFSGKFIHSIETPQNGPHSGSSYKNRHFWQFCGWNS